MEIDLIEIDLRDYDLMKLSSASFISIFILCEKMMRTKDEQQENTKKINENIINEIILFYCGIDIVFRELDLHGDHAHGDRSQ